MLADWDHRLVNGRVDADDELVVTEDHVEVLHVVGATMFTPKAHLLTSLTAASDPKADLTRRRSPPRD